MRNYNPENRPEIALIAGLFRLVAYPFRMLFRFACKKIGPRRNGGRNQN